MNIEVLPKAVLFDMDGVLVDARDWHFEALNLALGHFGLEIDRHTHLRLFDGLPTKVKLKMLSEDTGLPQELHPLINKLKQRYTMQITYAKCLPIYHILQLIRFLSSKDVKIAVCSNSIRSTIESMMNLSGLSPYIDLILSNEDVTQSKPHPEIYNKAIEYFALDKSECLIVEDSDHGIQAAKAAGCSLAIVSGPDQVNFSILNHFF